MKLLSPAKINLFLHVTGRRSDGYHELYTLMSRISLYDTIVLENTGGGIGIHCSHPDVPEDETNLAYRAAALFFKEVKQKGGIDITIEKHIPVAAGLGGGSSNAATILLELNRLYEMPFSMNRLMEMGLLLGADVPFFIFGKPAIATGIGEILNEFKMLYPFSVIAVNPGYCVSTAKVYKKINLRLTKAKKKHKEVSFDVQEDLWNDLETVVRSDHSEIDGIKEMLLDNGAAGALMSGSGPTMFGLFFDSKTAKAAFSDIRLPKGYQKFLADILS